MNTRELFKRRVIELIHGLPYEDAINKLSNDEWKKHGEFKSHVQITAKRLFTNGYNMEQLREAARITYVEMNPITIGRVMKAMNKLYVHEIVLLIDYFDYYEIQWNLTNDKGIELTDDEQSDETIEAIYNLIKE